MSFQPRFREAAKTLVLCMKRSGIPNELNARIIECLPRDWWPDERKECSNYRCQLLQVQKRARAKAAGLPYSKPVATLFCPKCRTRFYCSKSCREQDFKDVHKRECGRTPFRTLQKHEAEVFAALSSVSTTQDLVDRQGDETSDKFSGAHFTVGQDDEVDIEDGESDDDSWESIESDDDDAEEEQNRSLQTTLICRLIEKTG